MRQVWTLSSIDVFIEEGKSVTKLSRYLVNKEGYCFNTKQFTFRKVVNFLFFVIYLKPINVLVGTVY